MSACRSSAGWLFHSYGPAAAKHLSPVLLRSNLRKLAEKVSHLIREENWQQQQHLLHCSTETVLSCLLYNCVGIIVLRLYIYLYCYLFCTLYEWSFSPQQHGFAFFQCTIICRSYAMRHQQGLRLYWVKWTSALKFGKFAVSLYVCMSVCLSVCVSVCTYTVVVFVICLSGWPSSSVVQWTQRYLLHRDSRTWWVRRKTDSF